MYLHLGGTTIIPKRDIIAILDSKTNKSQATREFIQIAEDEDFIIPITSKEKIKSFVITSNKIYMSPISCVTLKKRSSGLFKMSE